MKRMDDQIKNLEQQLKKQGREGTESHRSKLIKSQQTKIRDLEFVADFLKSEMGLRCGMESEAVNEMILKKTCGAPRRFRPMVREEMENKVL